MLDLETFGKKPGCVIRSLGAVFFDLKGRTGAELYRNITQGSCLEAGLTIDPETAAWWSRQSQASQEAFAVNPVSLKNVVMEFSNWFGAKGGQRVWCQGATFDAPVWEAATEAVGKRVPWKFWNVRDTRTVYDLYGFDPKSIERAGTYHNALDDAKHQVRCLQAAVEKYSLSTL